MTNQQWDVLFYNFPRIAHFTVTCQNEAGVDLLLILCKSCCSLKHNSHYKRKEVRIRTRTLLKVVDSLASLEVRSRNEEEIISSRNRIYSLKVLRASKCCKVKSFRSFLLFIHASFLLHTAIYRMSCLSTSTLFTCFWIDLVRVLATTGNTSAVAGYTRVYIHEHSRASIPEKLHNCQRSKKWFTRHVISIIGENKPHSRHNPPLHTMKVYNTRPSQFC